MKIASRQTGELMILRPEGPITIGVGDVALREAVEAALGAGGRNILVDLEAVTRMDSSAMAELIGAYNKVRDAGGSLKLLRLPPNIQRVLGFAQLTTIFDIFEEEDEAIASFD